MAFIVSGLILITCRNDALNELTKFNFETDYVVKVPASPITPVPVDIVTPQIATHSDVLFSANRTRADMVEHVSLAQLILTVKTPQGGDLKFLKSVDIYANAEGLPEVRVAYKDIIPDEIGDTLNLDVTGEDLKQYFAKDKYTLRISVTSDRATTQDYGINAHGVFIVDAKVL